MKKLIITLLIAVMVGMTACADGGAGDDNTTASHTTTTPSTLCLYYTYLCGNTDEFISSLGFKCKKEQFVLDTVEVSYYISSFKQGTMVILDPATNNKILVSKYKDKIIYMLPLADN